MAALGPRPRNLAIPNEAEVQRRLWRTTGTVFVAFALLGWLVMYEAASRLGGGVVTGLLGVSLLMSYGAVLGYLLLLASRREVALIRTTSIFLGESPIAVGFTDEKGKITYANPALERLTGRSLAELADGPGDAFVHPEDRARMAAEAARSGARPGRAGSYALRVLRADGTVLKTLISVMPFEKDGNFDGSLAVVVDLTELEAAREAAERSGQLAAFALDVVTHDLSNTMQSVAGRADLAVATMKGDEPAARKALAGVQDATGRATRLIREVKQIAAADRENWPKREVDVKALLDAALKGVAVPGDTPVQVQAAPEALGLSISVNDLAAVALGKLVEEAADAPPGKRRPIGIHVLVEESGALVFRVTGAGRNISADDLKSMVAAPRELAAKDKPWRAGVRLALAASIAEAHGWQLRALPAEGGGSVFEVRGANRGRP